MMVMIRMIEIDTVLMKVLLNALFQIEYRTVNPVRSHND